MPEFSSHSLDQNRGTASAATPGGKTLEANEYKVGELFDSRFVFSLFKAQRPYIWDEDRALKLLEDFLTQLKDSSTSNQ